MYSSHYNGILVLLCANMHSVLNSWKSPKRSLSFMQYALDVVVRCTKSPFRLEILMQQSKVTVLCRRNIPLLYLLMHHVEPFPVYFSINFTAKTSQKICDRSFTLSLSFCTSVLWDNCSNVGWLMGGSRTITTTIIISIWIKSRLIIEKKGHALSRLDVVAAKGTLTFHPWQDKDNERTKIKRAIDLRYKNDNRQSSSFSIDDRKHCY